MQKIKEFFTQEDGQGMVEYGLIIAVVAIVVVVAIGLMGDGLVGTFDAVTDKLPEVTS